MKHKYICDDCNIEMYETEGQNDMFGNKYNSEKISLACPQCEKWAFVERK